MTFHIEQLPLALKYRLKNQLKDQYDDFELAMAAPSPVSIRLNPRKPTNHFSASTIVPWCPHGRYLESRPRFTDDPQFHAGTYYVQEASSMFLSHLVTELVDLEQDLRVLDLSAAPGGKSTLLQSLISQDSILVANEIISGRNKILRQNMVRWGGDNHIVTQSDPKYFKKLPGFFDVILVDAPCSGEGLMRKEPSAMKEWSEQHVLLCAARQKRILGDILPALAPGGILIYSTCTFSESENEENMQWLDQESSLTPLSVNPPESWGIQNADMTFPSYRFYPHRLKGEGFFIAAFRKNEGTSYKRTRNRSNPPSHRIESATTEDKYWLASTNRYAFLTRDQHRIALPKTLYDDYLDLIQNLRVTSSGLNMGKVYHKRLKPSAELALSQYVSSELPRIELETEQALDYLAHLKLAPYGDLAQGRYLICHGGYGLGWLHILKTGQIRNNYPAAWRILQRYSK